MRACFSMPVFIIRRRTTNFSDTHSLLCARPCPLRCTSLLVVCATDSHFTAFQVLRNRTLIYYDPLNASLSLVGGDSYDRLVGFLLLKCNYGDSQHMQEHGSHYTGSESNATRRLLYNMWRKINKLTIRSLYGLNFTPIPMNLDQYILLNAPDDSTMMSTQLTGNTCYFQVYLFALLCKAGRPEVSGRALELTILRSSRSHGGDLPLPAGVFCGHTNGTAEGDGEQWQGRNRYDTAPTH